MILHGKVPKIYKLKELLDKKIYNKCCRYDFDLRNIEKYPIDKYEFKTILEEINQSNSPDEISPKVYKYIKLAAVNGYIEAQYFMKYIKNFGIGTKINVIEGHAWLLTGVAQNTPFGLNMAEKNAAKLDVYEKNEAESLSENYIRKYTDLFNAPSITISH